MSKIVLNIPHCNTNGIFDNVIGKWPRNYDFYNKFVRKLTDWYTDYLFSTHNENVTSVVFPYSRFVCDVERLDNDPMEEKGQGVLYEYMGSFERGELSLSALKTLTDARFEHYNNIGKHLENGSVLIDCHSFTQEHDDDPDICIGFNDDDSFDMHLVNIIKNEFEKSGYKVKMNYPFSNSITPVQMTDDFNYKSVMIEVNKRVYMDEDTLMLNNNPRQWMRWFGCLDRIYDSVCEYVDEKKKRI